MIRIERDKTGKQGLWYRVCERGMIGKRLLCPGDYVLIDPNQHAGVRAVTKGGKCWLADRGEKTGTIYGQDVTICYYFE